MLILEIAAGVALAPVVFVAGLGLLGLAMAVIALPFIVIGGLKDSDREAKIGACLFAVTLVTWLAYS